MNNIIEEIKPLQLENNILQSLQGIEGNIPKAENLLLQMRQYEIMYSICVKKIEALLKEELQKHKDGTTGE